MPAIPVPELRRKFALLRAYSARTNWELLAVPFGVSPKTVKYWGHGSATHAPDQIPAEKLPVLLSLFAELLPRAPVAEDVRPLVFGPAARLEAEIRSGAASSLAELIAREGQTGTASLFTKADEHGLVEIEEEKSHPEARRLRLGAWFRIVFPLRPSCRHVATLQGVQRAWAAVPSDRTSTAPLSVLVPGLNDDQTPRFMRERRDAGLHRFVCLQSAEPFPLLVEEALRETVLFDQRGLETLAGFYRDRPASQRACHVLTVTIEPDAPV